ncbi:MAG TPA: helix-turn-helix domain-containing protein [Chryseosolibacter sp.]|nr:helix-turn-helix domain-containing protein [Chryseosolibacter sp.]
MPYKIDLFALFIFLGIVQALFLSLFFLSPQNRKLHANFFYGILLISIALCSLEIFLMYSGYIINVLHLVDFSEPISFVIGPAFYLMVVSVSRGKVSASHYLHFVLPLIYLLLVFPFFLLPEDVKYNSWVESYDLNLPYRPFSDEDPRMFWITDHHTLLTFISVILYGLLSLVEVIRAFRSRGESFLATQIPALKSLRTGVFHVGLALVITGVIKMLNKNDTGDHIFAAYLSVIIYITSFRVMKGSGFFRSTGFPEAEKPKASLVSPDQQQQIVERLNTVMREQKPFLKTDFSLPGLALLTGTSVHALSFIINTVFKKSFFELTAEYRIEYAKDLLRVKKNIKVDEIAEQVGYNSRSSFTTAFKKITGKTPSEYRDQV